MRQTIYSSAVCVMQGPDPSFANCGMPYFIGKEIQNRNALNVQTPLSLLKRLNLDVRCLSEVKSS
jgi:hypothetical protein